MISLFISFAVAATPVYDQLAAGGKAPLGGSFEAGEKILRAGDPASEANEVYKSKGALGIVVCGFACVPPGGQGLQSGPAIPATSDTLNEKNKGYNEAAQDFALKFNKEMLKLKAPAPKALNDGDLTVSGVIVGKSNLYNSIPKFGPNAFHKESDRSIVCWKGDDGTTLAFESLTKEGGPDQTITSAHLLSGDYAFASECKPSKKVSATLSLAGLHLGDSLTDVQGKRGGELGDGTLKYAFDGAGKRKKTVHFSIDLAAKDDKINDIAVGKTESN